MTKFIIEQELVGLYNLQEIIGFLKIYIIHNFCKHVCITRYTKIKYNKPTECFTNSYLYLLQVYNPKEADEIEEHLKKVICKHLGDPQPEICN